MNFAVYFLNGAMVDDIHGEVRMEDTADRKQAEELMRLQRDICTALGNTSNLSDTLVMCMDAVLEVKGVDCGGNIYD